jgi:hypothetical protein
MKLISSQLACRAAQEMAVGFCVLENNLELGCITEVVSNPLIRFGGALRSFEMKNTRVQVNGEGHDYLDRKDVRTVASRLVAVNATKMMHAVGPHGLPRTRHIRHSAPRCIGCGRPEGRGHIEGCWVARATISRFA